MTEAALIRPDPGAALSGLWSLAWQRFARDRLGLASFYVVLLFIALMIAAAAGWIAADWSEEVGVNYAPPAFIGPEPGATATLELPARQQQSVESSVADPL